MNRTVKSALMSVMLLFMVGCQYSKQFSKAMSPIADDMLVTATPYIQAMPDGDQKTQVGQIYGGFVNAVHDGNRDLALELWDAVPGVRSTYVEFVSNDPLYASADGQITLSHIYGNINYVDYLFRQGPKASLAGAEAVRRVPTLRPRPPTPPR